MPDPTTTLPSVGDQFAAVLNAPLPFLLALAAVAFVVWRAFEWRYAGVTEKTKSLWELAEHDAKAAKEREAELKETVQKLTEELSDIRNKKDAELADKLVKIEKVAAEVATQVKELEKANNAVSETVRRGAVSSGATIILEPTTTVLRSDR
jgi:hypothetical protein